MKLAVRCPSGLRLEFEGTIDELNRFDGFLAAVACLERERLAPDALSRAALTPAPDPEPAPDPPAVRRQQSPSEPRVIGAAARARMDEQLYERHQAHRAQIRELVREFGPCTPAFVADQLVKNRRDTLALMRNMTAAGELLEPDAGFYAAPDHDELAA